jgi:diguanylate cyclase
VRYGGEEFAILCRNTGQNDARMLAERIRTQIESLPFSFNGTTYRQTTSVGVAVLMAGEAAASLLKRADDALYRAKQNGRNRVEAAS